MQGGCKKLKIFLKQEFIVFEVFCPNTSHFYTITLLFDQTIVKSNSLIKHISYTSQSPVEPVFQTVLHQSNEIEQTQFSWHMFNKLQKIRYFLMHHRKEKKFTKLPSQLGQQLGTCKVDVKIKNILETRIYSF